MSEVPEKKPIPRIVRRKKLRPLRYVLQAVSFFVLVLLVPIGILAVPAGICAIPVGDLFRIDCLYGFLQRFFYSPLNVALWALVAFVAVPFLGSLLLGRVFCGLMCPIGAILDLIGKIRRVNFLGKLKLNNKYNKYAVLASFTAASAATGFPVFCAICPVRGICTAYGSIKPMELALAAVPVVLEFSERRAWCRYFCPIGGAFGLVGYKKLFGLKINLENCVKCKTCMRVCPTGAITEESLATGEISRTACILCLRCYDACMCGATVFGRLPLRTSRVRRKPEGSA